MIDPKEIIKLLESGKKDAAKKQLIEYLESAEISPDEAAKVYSDFASLYLDVQNEVMGRYKNFLSQVVEELKEFNAKEKQITQ
ncbi:MAG: hypothetical protein AAB646_03170 [Patescibacteria group bacterium]